MEPTFKNARYLLWCIDTHGDIYEDCGNIFSPPLGHENMYKYIIEELFIDATEGEIALIDSIPDWDETGMSLYDACYIFNLFRAFLGKTFDYNMEGEILVWGEDEKERMLDITQYYSYHCYIIALFAMCIYAKNKVMIEKLYAEFPHLHDLDESLVWVGVTLQRSRYVYDNVYDENFILYLIKLLNIKTIHYENFKYLSTLNHQKYSYDLLLIFIKYGVEILFNSGTISSNLNAHFRNDKYVYEGSGVGLEMMLRTPGYPIFDKELQRAHLNYTYAGLGDKIKIEEHLAKYANQEERDKQIRLDIKADQLLDEMIDIKHAIRSLVREDELSSAVIDEAYQSTVVQTLNNMLEETQKDYHNFMADR